MSETRLVTWDAPENLGKVPESDWICPVGDVTMLSLYEMLGGEVDDDAIRRWADGRPQHLELLQYPEGYHALQVVDSESGQVLQDGAASREYSSYQQYIEDCNVRSGFYTEPGTRFIIAPELGGQQLNLDEGRRMTLFSISRGTSYIAVHSRPFSTKESDAETRLRGSLILWPQTKSMTLSSYGKAGDFEGEVTIMIAEGRGLSATGMIQIEANDPESRHETIMLSLDGHGQVTAVDADSRSTKILRKFGADPSTISWSPTGNGRITNPDDQQRVAGNVAEIFALGQTWEGIDLRLTAAGLYAMFGQDRPDLNQIIVPQSSDKRPL